MTIDRRLLLLAPGDNVLVVREQIEAGDTVLIGDLRVDVPRHLGLGHKVAATAIASCERIIKYGAPIGRATTDIAPGEHVHVENVASDYTPTYVLPEEESGR